MDNFVLNIAEDLRFTDDEFFRFCQDNPDLKLERDKYGNILVMALTGLKTGFKNSEINADLVVWNRRKKAGIVFDSSSGFRLPDTSVKSPDAAWISKERWDKLSENDKEKFGNLCPDFVVELMSPSDSLKQAQEKMQEWMKNGCRLAWLIDTTNQKAYIYRENDRNPEMPDFTNKLSGENVLEGFEFDLSILI